MNDLRPRNAGSPFDAIRRTREDGTEYWSARDLMPILGYEKWERFADSLDYSVDQAAKALAASGATLPDGRKVGRNLLFDWVGTSRDKGGAGWLFRNPRNQWSPYQQHTAAGTKRLTVKLGRYQDEHTGEEHSTVTVRITPKGVADIAVLLGVLPEAVAARLESDDAAA